MILLIQCNYILHVYNKVIQYWIVRLVWDQSYMLNECLTLHATYSSTHTCTFHLYLGSNANGTALRFIRMISIGRTCTDSLSHVCFTSLLQSSVDYAHCHREHTPLLAGLYLCRSPLSKLWELLFSIETVWKAYEHGSGFSYCLVWLMAGLDIQIILVSISVSAQAPTENCC